MNNLPKMIADYWSANRGTLPALWLEYAPASDDPPVAVYRPMGFSRDYANVGLMMDTHRYKFDMLDTDPVAAYENGFNAITLLYAFTCPGLIVVSAEPDDFATPSETGQANVWCFGFNVDFKITPS
jgi:hypothetical protein